MLQGLQGPAQPVARVPAVSQLTRPWNQSCRSPWPGMHAANGPSQMPCRSRLGAHTALTGAPAEHSPPSTTGISEWMSPRPAVIHWTPPGPMVPLLPQESWCCILPAGQRCELTSDNPHWCAALQRPRPSKGHAGVVQPWGSYAGTMRCKHSAAVLAAEVDAVARSCTGVGALGSPGRNYKQQSGCWCAGLHAPRASSPGLKFALRQAGSPSSIMLQVSNPLHAARRQTCRHVFQVRPIALAASASGLNGSTASRTGSHPSSSSRC